jgi:ArsR family transcriptional regulator
MGEPAAADALLQKRNGCLLLWMLSKGHFRGVLNEFGQSSNGKIGLTVRRFAARQGISIRSNHGQRLVVSGQEQSLPGICPREHIGPVELIQIYKCLCDETRLRILHLLTRRSLCVCHIQTILGLPQVAVSKHLRYLRARKLVQAKRHRQWMFYSLPEKVPLELDLQLRCLQDCVQTHAVFRKDLAKLKKIQRERDWMKRAEETCGSCQ